MHRHRFAVLDAIDARSRTWFNRILFSYKINPRRVFFLGYPDSSLGNDQIELTRENRTILLKVGCAWMLLPAGHPHRNEGVPYGSSPLRSRSQRTWRSRYPGA